MLLMRLFVKPDAQMVAGLPPPEFMAVKTPGPGVPIPSRTLGESADVTLLHSAALGISPNRPSRVAPAKVHRGREKEPVRGEGRAGKSKPDGHVLFKASRRQKGLAFGHQLARARSADYPPGRVCPLVGPRGKGPGMYLEAGYRKLMEQTG